MLQLELPMHWITCIQSLLSSSNSLVLFLKNHHLTLVWGMLRLAPINCQVSSQHMPSRTQLNLKLKVETQTTQQVSNRAQIPS